MFDLTLQAVLVRAAAFILVTMVHGFALAAAARLFGDRGPQYDNRFTLNPAPHLDLFGLVGASLFQAGWIKPVAIDPAELRGGRLGLVASVLIGLAAPLVVAAALLPLRGVALNTLSSFLALNAVLFFNTLGSRRHGSRCSTSSRSIR